MIVLVRCHDNTYAPALESHLEELVGKALISAFLSNGKWIEVRGQEEECEIVPPKRVLPRAANSLFACF